MILNMLKKFYLFFLLFILNSAYSNDLCNLLLNDNFIVPEVSINDGFAVITRVEIKTLRYILNLLYLRLLLIKERIFLMIILQNLLINTTLI